MDLSLFTRCCALCAFGRIGFGCRLAGISCDKILCDAFDCCSAPLCALSGGDLLSENFMSLKQLSVVHLWCGLCGYVTLFIKTVVNKAFTTRTFCLCGVQLSNDQLMFCGGHFRINVVLQYCCSSWGPWVSRCRWIDGGLVPCRKVLWRFNHLFHWDTSLSSRAIFHSAVASYCVRFHIPCASVTTALPIVLTSARFLRFHGCLYLKRGVK